MGLIKSIFKKAVSPLGSALGLSTGQMAGAGLTAFGLAMGNPFLATSGLSFLTQQRATGQQLDGLTAAQQQLLLQQQQILAQLRPFREAGTAALEQLQADAEAPLGQSETFQEALRMGEQGVRRSLAAQGGLLSGRQGVGLANLRAGLLASEMAARRQSLQSLASFGRFGTSGSVNALSGIGDNLAAIELARGRTRAGGTQTGHNMLRPLIEQGLTSLARRRSA